MTKSLSSIAVLLACATAFAQPRRRSPAPDPVKVHVDQGAALYNDGNFAGALAEFEEAYREQPAPYILNDIGLAQKALFHYVDAIASLEKFLAGSPNLSVETRKQTQQIIAEMKALLAPITIDVQPAGAAVVLDGKPVGASPLGAPVQLAAGSHTIEASADGYTPQKKEILVAGGVATNVPIRLAEIPRTGKVHVVASVQQATILIDGKPLGSWTIRAELVAGGHTLEVSAPGYQRHREELLLAAGQDREINIQLDPESPPTPWYKRWYVVTPIAVVLVGTIAGITIDLTTHQGPLDGTLGTGKVQ